MNTTTQQHDDMCERIEVDIGVGIQVSSCYCDYRKLERECGELREALEEVLRAIEHGGLKNEDGQMPDVFNIRAALAKVPK